MPTPVTSIIRAVKRKKGDKLNILAHATHERYQTGLANTNADFYLFRAEGIKDWNFDYAPLPKNHFLLDPSKGDSQIPPYVDFDLVLSQTEVVQCETAQRISRIYHIPHISLRHTLPHPNWPQYHLNNIKNQLRGDINIFISEFSRDKWGWTEDEAEVIHHGVDTDLFKPSPSVVKQKHILSVVNDWVNRDAFCGYNIYKKVTQDLPVRILGDTPGLSVPAKSVPHLVSEYQQSQIFINTSLYSPIPTVLLEGMACGLVPVSTDNCMISDVIKNDYNGYRTNDLNEMRKYLEMLLENPQKCLELGKNARKTILEKFPMDKFVDKWNDVFNRASKIKYVG